jgi:hypothetical protein
VVVSFGVGLTVAMRGILFVRLPVAMGMVVPRMTMGMVVPRVVMRVGIPMRMAVPMGVDVTMGVAVPMGVVVSMVVIRRLGGSAFVEE